MLKNITNKIIIIIIVVVLKSLKILINASILYSNVPGILETLIKIYKEIEIDVCKI